MEEHVLQHQILPTIHVHVRKDSKVFYVKKKQIGETLVNLLHARMKENVTQKMEN